MMIPPSNQQILENQAQLFEFHKKQNSQKKKTTGKYHRQNVYSYTSVILEQIVEEAGGAVTRMDGGKFTVFDRSVLVSNGTVHEKLLERIGPATEELKKKGIDFSLWFKPENYPTDF